MLPASASDQPALVAFVGTLGAGLTWGGSIVINPLMARVEDWSLGRWKGNVKWLTTAGVLCMSVGFGLASFGTKVCDGFSSEALKKSHFYLLKTSASRHLSDHC